MGARTHPASAQGASPSPTFRPPAEPTKYGVPRFWLATVPGVGEGRSHLTFGAADRLTVDAVWAGARELGTEILHEPREWPEYHEGNYGVFVRDPDGNNVEAETHR